MTPIGHFAAGFAAKPLGARLHLGIWLTASWLLDILYLIFAFTGLESAESLTKPGSVPSPWSHGLFMALVWSLLAGVVAWRVYRHRQTGLLIGLVVFSHWVLDFIFWDNLFLFFEGSPQVGLGLFNRMGSSTTYIELGLLAIGVLIYGVAALPRLRGAGQHKVA